MSDTLLLTEADQDRVLLEIYSLSRAFLRGKVAKQNIDDAVHDIATDCLIKLRTGVWTEAPDNMQAFVRKLVRDYVIDRRRKRVPREEHDAEHLRAREAMPPAWVLPDRPDDDEESIADFRRQVLSKVPKCFREAYYIVREQGLSYEEAAGRMGVTPETVHDYIKKANRAFRKELRVLGIANPKHVEDRTSDTNWRSPEARFAPAYVSHEPANALD
jgi:RNA polymerase sigma factor (sigma-70 family)